MYTSYQGKISDVSESSLWVDGEHMDSHLAGNDLTEEISTPETSRVRMPREPNS